MTFDELVLAISNSESLKQNMVNLEFLIRWKTSSDDAFRLVEKMDRFIVEQKLDQNVLDELLGYWHKFKNASIDAIHGMTVNERLYQFGLFAKFENCKNEMEENRIYAKLMAKR